MTARAWWRERAALSAAILLALSTPLHAEPFERPPTFEPGKIKGIKRADGNYAIRNPVRSGAAGWLSLQR